ncbi:DNA primase [Sphingosinithalassobacter tenebrarum]|uniref:DNA primase n=2 Tax=Stakelama tenebrarum TaxID=2711215 RepID=A0A6G6Y9S4_9SPHN|nr:DNA primase [Sphingosinithalassobacter tenebrarum]
MGGHQVSGRGPGDDGYDEDGYDESQRAEYLETTRGGPNDGATQTDLDPDYGEEIDNEEEDASGEMFDAELAQENPASRLDVEDREEDEIQADYDNKDVSGSELRAALDPSDESALEP